MRMRFLPFLIVTLLLLGGRTLHAEEDQGTPEAAAEAAAEAALRVARAAVAERVKALDPEGIASEELLKAIEGFDGKQLEVLWKTLAGVEGELPRAALRPTTAVTIDVRIIEAEENFLQDIGTDIRGSGEPQAFDARGTFLDDTQLEVILRALEKSERLNMISAPRITSFDGQRANVSVLDQKSIVADYEIEVRGAGDMIADPIIEVIHSGVVVDLQATVSDDKRFVTLETDGRFGLLEKIEETDLILQDFEPMRIQVPHFRHLRAAGNFTIPDGGTILVPAHPEFGNRDASPTRMLLISVTVTELLDIEGGQEIRLVPEERTEREDD